MVAKLYLILTKSNCEQCYNDDRHKSWSNSAGQAASLEKREWSSFQCNVTMIRLSIQVKLVGQNIRKDHPYLSIYHCMISYIYPSVLHRNLSVHSVQVSAVSTEQVTFGLSKSRGVQLKTVVLFCWCFAGLVAMNAVSLRPAPASSVGKIFSHRSPFPLTSVSVRHKKTETLK